MGSETTKKIQNGIDEGESGLPEGSRGARKGGRNGRDGHMQIQGARLVHALVHFVGSGLSGLSGRVTLKGAGEIATDRRPWGRSKRPESGDAQDFQAMWKGVGLA